jgi:predicted RNA binding protein YcfA (HicA-like mRNA interferase family)
MKVKEMIAIVERDGWKLRGFTGSHRQYVHSVKPGKVTIPGRSSADLHAKTAASILRRQA